MVSVVPAASVIHTANSMGAIVVNVICGLLDPVPPSSVTADANLNLPSLVSQATARSFSLHHWHGS